MLAGRDHYRFPPGEEPPWRWSIASRPSGRPLALELRCDDSRFAWKAAVSSVSPCESRSGLESVVDPESKSVVSTHGSRALRWDARPPSTRRSGHATCRHRSLRGTRGLEGGGGGRPPTRPGRGARQGPGGRGVVHRRAAPRRHVLSGGPKPPFTPGYELVGVVEELGPGCARLRVGDRVGALTVCGRRCRAGLRGGDSTRSTVPEDLDPAEVVSLIFPYMTAYQMLHRTARVKSGETVLVHGAAGRVGIGGARAGSGGRASPLSGPLQRATATWSSGSARPGDRLPQRGLPGSGAGVDRPAKVSTSFSTGSAARWRCAPSARCERARQGDSVRCDGAPTTRSVHGPQELARL